MGDPRGSRRDTMVFGQGGPTTVFAATRPMDTRKGIDGLTLAVQEVLGLDRFCGVVFLFRSKRTDLIRLLVWDQIMIVLLHERLEGGNFVYLRCGTGSFGCPRRNRPRCSISSTGGW